jgi:hypothetical protein
MRLSSKVAFMALFMMFFAGYGSLSQAKTPTHKNVATGKKSKKPRPLFTNVPASASTPARSGASTVKGCDYKDPNVSGIRTASNSPQETCPYKAALKLQTPTGGAGAVGTADALNHRLHGVY